MWSGYSDWVFPSAGVPLWLVNLAKEGLRLHFCSWPSLEDPHTPTHMHQSYTPPGRISHDSQKRMQTRDVRFQIIQILSPFFSIYIICSSFLVSSLLFFYSITKCVYMCVRICVCAWVSSCFQSRHHFPSTHTHHHPPAFYLLAYCLTLPLSNISRPPFFLFSVSYFSPLSDEFLLFWALFPVLLQDVGRRWGFGGVDCHMQ